MTEMEQLDYEDAIITFRGNCINYGAFHVLKDFQKWDPEFFEEIRTQINRIPPWKQQPALLR